MEGFADGIMEGLDEGIMGLEDGILEGVEDRIEGRDL